MMIRSKVVAGSFSSRWVQASILQATSMTSHNTTEEKNSKKARMGDAMHQRLSSNIGDSAPLKSAHGSFDSRGELIIATPDTSNIRPNIHASFANVVVDELACESQRTRALALWNKVTSCLDIEQCVVKGIQSNLLKGIVPPIFHAYSLQYKRLLDVQDGRLSLKLSEELLFEMNNLSSKKATVGAAKAYKNNFRIPKSGEFMSTLFDEDSEMARLRVEDSFTSWVFDCDLTTKVCNLVNAGAAMAGEDVEVTPVDSDFAIGCVRHCSKAHLITRCLSRGVVANCFNDLTPEDTRYIVGNPGIGKSWTLIYALQQALLYNGACVLFFAMENDKAMLCVRRKDQIFVWDADTVPEKLSSFLFLYADVMVLMDPDADGTKFPRGARRFICAASNNEKHFAKTHLNPNRKPMRYLNPFTEEEVYAALPYMMKPGEFNKDVVLERGRKVGFLPRWLLSEDKTTERFDEVKSAISKLPQSQMDQIIRSGGQFSSEATLPDTIFAISALPRLIHDVGKDVDGTATENMQVDGSPVGIDNTVTDAPAQRFEKVGYDGESGVDYEKHLFSILSPLIWREITKQALRDPVVLGRH